MASEVRATSYEHVNGKPGLPDNALQMNEPTSAVFLSHASQDAAAARRIGEDLRAAGVEFRPEPAGNLRYQAIADRMGLPQTAKSES